MQQNCLDLGTCTCINPFIFLIEYAEWYITQNPNKTFEDVLNMDNVFPNDSDVCCDSCDDLYVLGGDLSTADNSVIDFLKTFDISENCCFNYYGTIREPFINIKNIFGTGTDPIDISEVDLKGCCTPDSFTKCIDEMIKYFDDDELSKYIIDLEGADQTGIYEKVVDGNTLLCQLFEYLKDKPKADAIDYVLTVLKNGLVVSCSPTQTTITSISTYIQVHS